MDIAILKTRVLTGLIFGALIIGCITAGLWTATALLVLVGAGCTWEYLRIVLPNRPAIRWSAVILFLCLSMMSVSFKAEPSLLYKALLIQCTVFIIMLIHLWLPFIQHEKAWFVQVFFYTMMPFLLAIGCLHHLSGETHFLLWILILIWMSDSAAYFAGSWWGKNKLFERISPKKTWEGFMGAGFFAILTGFLLCQITDALAFQKWLILSVLIWVLGTLGDLYESAIKRTFNIKDSGHFLPGHGGFLDRFDSFIYVLPFSLLVLFFMD